MQGCTEEIQLACHFGGETLTSLLLHELGIDASRMNALSLLGNPRIKVIDGERLLLKAISATFPRIDVINHQLDDEHLMEEENIGNADIVLSLTSNQSNNILGALLAKKWELGVHSHSLRTTFIALFSIRSTSTFLSTKRPSCRAPFWIRSGKPKFAVFIAFLGANTNSSKFRFRRLSNIVELKSKIYTCPKVSSSLL